MNLLESILKQIDHHFSCRAKVTYGHQETAERAAKEVDRKYGTTLEAYPCRHCNGWHIGHKKD